MIRPFPRGSLYSPINKHHLEERGLIYETRYSVLGELTPNLIVTIWDDRHILKTSYKIQYMEIVSDRVATLMSIISALVVPGTEFLSDWWASYCNVITFQELQLTAQ